MQQENIISPPHYYEQEWFEELPLKCQQFISWFVESSEFSKNLSQEAALYFQYLAYYITASSIAKLNPMDINIFKEYEQSKKRYWSLKR